MSVSSSVDQSTGLKRIIKASISAEKVAETYDKHVTKLMQNGKLPGFRPGKIPRRVIEQRFGQNLRLDVARELIDGNLASLFSEHKLQPISQPDIDIPHLDDFTPDQSLDFSVTFEIYPEIELADLSGVVIERSVAQVSDSDIDEIVTRIQKQHVDKTVVERASANGDYVKIDFEGVCEGESFPGNSANDFELELGAGTMIAGFEDGIVGAAAGEAREVNCHFPDDYHAKSLAGKDAVFKVKVKEVLAASLPEINDEFAKKVGIEEGVAAMREQIKQNLEKTASTFVQNKLRERVVEKIMAMHEFDLPETLLSQEIDHIRKQNSKMEEQELDKEARKHIKLGLLLRHVVTTYDLKADSQQVREYIEQMVANYQYPEHMMRWYYEDQQRLQRVESIVLEHQALDKLLDLMKVEDKPVAYTDIKEHQA